MMSVLVGLAGLLMSQWALAQAATIAVGTPLKILDGQPEQITIKTAKGPVTITRKMTACGKNGGVMQPLVPVKGVHPVAEIEVIAALGDAGSIVLDMRDTNDRVKGTIPGSVGIPYTEVASRMNELGCTKTGAKWNCGKAKKVYAFCNGPACPQSPMAIRAMTRDGFPADKIYYYRGGMLDWDALGLTSVKDEF
ncbi:sulfurtransferase [Betaproteobacteria bacterium LSUCC0115]|nr:sulfurtransferase [Burkholderiales bacterium LSUCC0115]